MMSMNMTQEVEIGITKPPFLRPGTYQRWKDLFTQWIKSVDYQCWLVIEKGDGKVDPALLDGT